MADIKKELEQYDKYIEYEDDWDGEGSKGYTKETLERTKAFIIDCYNDINADHSEYLSVPKILPGPFGSFDILWENEHFEALINVPENPKIVISFFVKRVDTSISLATSLQTTLKKYQQKHLQKDKDTKIKKENVSVGDVYYKLYHDDYYDDPVYDEEVAKLRFNNYKKECKTVKLVKVITTEEILERCDK